MKKLLFIGFFCLFNSVVFAQNQTDSLSTSQTSFINLSDFAGKYRIKNAPIEFILLSVQNGKLIGEVEGQETVELIPLQEKDTFNVANYGAVVLFIRDETNRVKNCKLTIQGNTLEGELIN